MEELSRRYAMEKQEIFHSLSFLSNTQVLPGRHLASWITEYFKDLERLVWKYQELTNVAKTEYNNTDFKGFINVTLTSAEKELFAAWEVHDNDLFELVASRIQSGYKLSCGYNAQNDTFTASLTCARDKDPNKGYILPAFAKDWYHAVRVMAFKDLVLLDGNWQSAKDRVSDNIG